MGRFVDSSHVVPIIMWSLLSRGFLLGTYIKAKGRLPRQPKRRYPFFGKEFHESLPKTHFQPWVFENPITVFTLFMVQCNIFARD